MVHTWVYTLGYTLLHTWVYTLGYTPLYTLGKRLPGAHNGRKTLKGGFREPHTGVYLRVYIQGVYASLPYLGVPQVCNSGVYTWVYLRVGEREACCAEWCLSSHGW